MIKFEKTDVMNFENAVRGARNPMNSWDKSDSGYIIDCKDMLINQENCYPFMIGKNDLALLKKLVKAGSDHRKFMRQIFVSVDITAPLYWWKEFDTYKVGTVANSTSTMHKIHSEKITIDNFSHEHLNEWGISLLQNLCNFMNHNRNEYNETNDKDRWWQIIQMLPTSWNQMRTVTMNYETLLNVYHARLNHKLDEWRSFCGWIETLPYAKELICFE